MLFQPLGGQIARMPDDANAINPNAGRWVVHACIGEWETRAETEAELAWVRRGAMIEPFELAGAPLTFSADTGDERVRATFGEEKYARLVALKDKYDPENLFRLNQNIKPSRVGPTPAGEARLRPSGRLAVVSWPRDDAKLERVRALMAEEDLDALVVRAPDNVLYLSNFLPMKGYDVVVFPREGEPTLDLPRAVAGGRAPDGVDGRRAPVQGLPRDGSAAARCADARRRAR